MIKKFRFAFVFKQWYEMCVLCVRVGIKGTYQGLTATMMKQGSNQAIRFFVVESLKDWYRDGDNKKSVPKLITGCFGAIAGAASVFGNTPLDVIKTRMQVHDSGLKPALFRSVHCKLQFTPKERSIHRKTVESVKDGLQRYSPIRRQAVRWTQRPPEAVPPLTVYGRFSFCMGNGRIGESRC